MVAKRRQQARSGGQYLALVEAKNARKAKEEAILANPTATATTRGYWTSIPPESKCAPPPEAVPGTPGLGVG